MNANVKIKKRPGAVTCRWLKDKQMVYNVVRSNIATTKAKSNNFINTKNDH